MIWASISLSGKLGKRVQQVMKAENGTCRVSRMCLGLGSPYEPEE